MQQHLTNPESKLAKELADVIDKESFIFEFHYAKLYVFSLALSPSPKNMYDSDKKNKRKSGKFNLKLDEISRSAKYIEQAFNSANEMLSVAHRIHKLKMLRFMPVRWVTRIVRAVAFIVKCYLTITAHKKTADSDASINSFNDFDSTILSLSLISIEEITDSIQRAAITLRDCSPDELHLCTRYSNVLMYLCSEMKVNSKSNNDNDDEIHTKLKNIRHQKVPVTKKLIHLTALPIVLYMRLVMKIMKVCKMNSFRIMITPCTLISQLENQMNHKVQI